MVKHADQPEPDPTPKRKKRKKAPELVAVPEVPFWPIVVCDKHISFWAYRFTLVHEDGRIDGRLDSKRKLVEARTPPQKEREEILADIARQRAFCERKLIELSAAEAALTGGGAKAA